ncbi:MAG: nucleotidyltransferase family protein [Terriglobales bacterium]
MMTSSPNSSHAMDLLSNLLFSRVKEDALRDLSDGQFQGMLTLGNSHHVVMRSMDTLRGIMACAHDYKRYEWASQAIERERGRIDNAISCLQKICAALASEKCDVVVIKSLDHWPDFGSDVDLYTNAPPEDVIRILTREFTARVEPRSWGDRLANKWNFVVPGVPELLEIHMGRLGQTGELTGFARPLVARSRPVSIGNHLFRVPSVEDRLVICTLQRMYRHFYIRLCDIADTAELLEAGVIDYEDLQSVAQRSGIWEGVATFLTIASDYLRAYRGRGVALPSPVRSAARFGASQVHFEKGFLRVPILPYSAHLYASEWATLMLGGNLRSTARLSLLPCLATAAALGQKITGSDKGIW